MGITPTYQRIVDAIHGDIAAGKLRPGDQLPSGAELQRQYNASSTVVRSAMLALRGMGLVEGHQGKGTYVRSDFRALGGALAGAFGDLDDAGLAALTPDQRAEQLQARRVLVDYLAGLRRGVEVDSDPRWSVVDGMVDLATALATRAADAAKPRQA
ncbi:winged helix-turn-helix domain-containing protein [Polymorphospora sp. NPDC050346]|uniref:winged helix-turn-helix domain-containing protein n=1 Tax=Polymorphospora sp. NPDC050346 TaxID=3155780 RepID=UPI003406CB6F